MIKYFKNKKWKVVGKRETDILGRRRIGYNLLKRKNKKWVASMWFCNLKIAREWIAYNA